jgi:hypothetical protein
MAKTKIKVPSADELRAAFRTHEGEQVGAHQLVGTWEAADIIGVEKPRIGRWMNKWRTWMFGEDKWQKSGGKEGTPPHHLASPDDWTYGPKPEMKLPEPLADLKAGPVWLRSDIEAFAAARQTRAQAA